MEQSHFQNNVLQLSEFSNWIQRDLNGVFYSYRHVRQHRFTSTIWETSIFVKHFTKMTETTAVNSIYITIFQTMNCKLALA